MMRIGGSLVSASNETFKFDLRHNGLFLLLPEDEVPILLDGKLFKFHHCVQKKGFGISAALIFRSINPGHTSKFDRRTGRWKHADDKKWQKKSDEFIQKHKKSLDKLHSIQEQPEFKNQMFKIGSKCKTLMPGV